MLDTGYWMVGKRFWILPACGRQGFRILDLKNRTRGKEDNRKKGINE